MATIYHVDGSVIFRDNQDTLVLTLEQAALSKTYLSGANLSRAIVPNGKLFEDYLKDPLEGICDDPEVKARAKSAWGNHTWTNCPMATAFGWKSYSDIPEDKQMLVGMFIALFDGKHLG